MSRRVPRSSHLRRPLVMATVAVAIQACDSDSRSSRKPGVEIVPVAPGTQDGPELIRREMDRARKDGRKLLLYVGATWCEPCQRFHEAAAAGQLDSTFPGLRLLEFDKDQHEGLLQQADCGSEMIPLFARPTPEGHCATERLEGAIKGEGAVAWITPRLKHLMAD